MDKPESGHFLKILSNSASKRSSISIFPLTTIYTKCGCFPHLLFYISPNVLVIPFARLGKGNSKLLADRANRVTKVPTVVAPAHVA